MVQGIAVVGSLNMDIVVTVDKLPAEGETLHGRGMSEVPGGKGANQAAAIGKLQTPVRMIGKVGTDGNGTALLRSLEDAGVDTSAIMTTPRTATGTAVVTVDGDGHNHIIVVPGANGELGKEDIDFQRHAIEQCDIVILQLEVPLETVAYTLRLAKELGKTTVLNPAPARKLDEDILRYVDILIPNEHELQVMAKLDRIDKQTLEQAARQLMEQGVGAVIVTLGEEGCFYADRDSMVLYPARKVKATDTTAAGDSFIGGFVAGYLASRDADAAIRQAQIAAAITVTRRGAQSSLPTRQEVEAVQTEWNE